MIWLALRLTQLPLDALRSGQQSDRQSALHSDQHLEQHSDRHSDQHSDQHSDRHSDRHLETAQPMAVVEQNKIICVNLSASKLGIKVNQTATTAQALSERLKLLARNRALELQQKNTLALLLYQFSSAVSIEPQALLLMEIGRSIKLYHNLHALLTALQTELSGEPVSYQLGLGNSPSAAAILSQRQLGYSLECWDKDHQLDQVMFKKKLEQLPVRLMDLSEKTIQQIHAVGIETIGQLRQHSVGELIKRFGKTMADQLLTLFAQKAEPKIFFKPAEIFFEQLNFNEPIHHQKALIFPIARLIKNLSRFLTVKQKNTQQLQWRLFDINKNSLCFDVTLSSAQISSERYLELTQLNLERVHLKAPVDAISLKVDQLVALIAHSGSLFAAHSNQPDGIADDCFFKQETHFVSKIAAKIGDNHCFRLQPQAEHVPELAQSLSDPTKPDAIDHKPVSNTPLPMMQNQIINPSAPLRPCWLFCPPQAIRASQPSSYCRSSYSRDLSCQDRYSQAPSCQDLHCQTPHCQTPHCQAPHCQAPHCQDLYWHGQLTIISQPERIASLWWQQKTARDYYFAQHASGVIYWIFFEKIQQQWFVHGVYS